MDVKDVMHTAVTTVTPETRVSTAHQVMTMRAARMRHLPVVTHEGILVGVLTDRDLRRAAASDAPPMVDAARVLVQRTIDCLPVVDHGTLVGVVTAIDCMRAFLQTASGA
jgi:acetoin utilization protein AcuB